MTWEKTHRGVQASREFDGLLPCELICDMFGTIINLRAPATIRSSTPSVSGSKFLIVVFCCATDHTTLFVLYLIIHSCHHLPSALTNSAQLEKQRPAACWAFGISARCSRWTLPRARSVTFCPADARTQRGAWKRKHGSPSPCTVVMRCPSRKRSTLERYEEGPLSTTTSFRTWGRTHKKQEHALMITCAVILIWLHPRPDLASAGLRFRPYDNQKQKYHHFFFPQLNTIDFTCKEHKEYSQHLVNLYVKLKYNNVTVHAHRRPPLSGGTVWR